MSLFATAGNESATLAWFPGPTHAATTQHAPPASPTVLLDAFESSSVWVATPASGVDMKLSLEPGPHGNALRVDFTFTKGGSLTDLRMHYRTIGRPQKDASGTVQSAFDNDETVLRVIVEHDLAVRYDRAIAVIEAVKWGA